MRHVWAILKGVLGAFFLTVVLLLLLGGSVSFVLAEIDSPGLGEGGILTLIAEAFSLFLGAFGGGALSAGSAPSRKLTVSLLTGSVFAGIALPVTGLSTGLGPASLLEGSVIIAGAFLGGVVMRFGQTPEGGKSVNSEQFAHGSKPGMTGTFWVIAGTSCAVLLVASVALFATKYEEIAAASAEYAASENAVENPRGPYPSPIPYQDGEHPLPEYSRRLMGKTPNQVRGILGPPHGSSDLGDGVEIWWYQYSDLVCDVGFSDGRVFACSVCLNHIEHPIGGRAEP